MLRKKIINPVKVFWQFAWQAWLMQYKMFVVLLAPLFLLFIFIAVKFSLKNSNAEQAFLKAQKVYSHLEGASSVKEESFQTLKGLLKKYPELKASYEALMIQKMLVLGEKEQAESLLPSFLKRLSKRPVSYYTQFANTTLKIEKGDVNSALREAISLKENMLADSVFWGQSRENHYGSTLFAFNLLRIAMLSQSLGKSEEELLAWRELKQYAKWDTESDKNLASLDPLAFNELLRHFTSQNISLKEYIKHREAQILVQKKRAV